jgi:hypothetical protein
MVGSPLRDMTCLDEQNIPWSPEFNLDVSNTPFVFHDNLAEFDIFNDPNLVHLGSLENPFSPERKTSKRPRLDRSRSANILAEIANKHGSFEAQLTASITSTPRLNFTPSLPQGSGFTQSKLSPAKSLSQFFNSPSMNLESPSKASASALPMGGNFDFNDEFLGAEFLEEEVGFGGLDIMQGFQKIGAGANGTAGRGTPKSGSSRPILGRSFTSRF